MLESKWSQTINIAAITYMELMEGNVFTAAIQKLNQLISSEKNMETTSLLTDEEFESIRKFSLREVDFT